MPPVLDRLIDLQQRLLMPLLDAHPRRSAAKRSARLASTRRRWEALRNPLGPLRSLGLIDYPNVGSVVELPWLFMDL